MMEIIDWEGIEVKVNKYVFEWTIKNFTHKVKKQNCMYSPRNVDSNTGRVWLMHLYPYGYDNDDDFVSIDLKLKNPSPDYHRRYTWCKISIINAQNDEISSQSVEEMFLYSQMDTMDVWECEDFIALKQLLHKPYYLSNKNLKLKCEITFTVNEMNLERYSILPEPSMLKYNFDQLLLDQTMADIIIVVQEKEFPAHKLILIARCTFFAAMFAHGMKESIENKVIIQDMEPEIFKEILKYIYTDETPNFSQIDANSLLVAADLYDLERLKVMCEKYLIINLSKDNLLTIQNLADTYNTIYLKQYVDRF